MLPRIRMTSPLFLHYTYICFHAIINKVMPIYYVSGKILLKHIKKLPSCQTDAFHCLLYMHMYLLYLYTTSVVWQTKCKLVMSIIYITFVHCWHAHAKIVCNGVCTCQLFMFTCSKCAGTHIYRHFYVKFK